VCGGGEVLRHLPAHHAQPDKCQFCHSGISTRYVFRLRSLSARGRR
jgi:predicted metal-dependent phosphotriesterase family hydrolase